MTAGHTTDNHPLMHSRFRWSVPTHFNIAQVCSRRWAASPAHASGTAEWRHQTEAGEGRASRYEQLQRAADAFSRVLFEQGVKPGDRVAVVLPQRFETAVAYIAILQMGAVAMPLSQLFGPV